MHFKSRKIRNFLKFFSDDVSEKRIGLYGGGGGKGGGGGGGQSYPSQTTQVTKSEPWAEQKPYLTTGFESAYQDIFRWMNPNDPGGAPPPQFYPNSTVVPFSPETNLAMQLQEQRALQGSPIQTAGTNQLTDTLSGNYLNQIGNLYNNPMQQMVNNDLVAPTLQGDYLFSNPGFNASVDAASRKIIPQVDSAFEKSGRLHSGLADTAKTQALSDSFASQYGQERQNQMQAAALGQQGTDTFLNNVGRERDNQIRSMMFAPQMASLDYQDFGKLAEVGAQKESLDQQNLADQISRWDYGQNQKINSLSQYMGLIQGNYGGTNSSTSNVNGMGGGSSGGFSPNIMGGMGGLLSSSMLGISPGLGFLGGLK